MMRPSHATEISKAYCLITILIMHIASILCWRISLRNWELPKWEPENWARNTENFKNWEDIFTEFFLVDDSKSSKTQNLQIWEILKLRIHKLGYTRLWELWITLHSNCEKNKTEKPKTTILSHQECKLWDQNFKWETIIEQLCKDSKWQFTF